MVPEAEAKQKWCPMVRVSNYVSGTECESSVNRLETNEPYDGCLCIASACMMWRWGDGRTQGYCGLAGKG